MIRMVKKIITTILSKFNPKADNIDSFLTSKGGT
jgi:hypothetical protein